MLVVNDSPSNYGNAIINNNSYDNCSQTFEGIYGLEYLERRQYKSDYFYGYLSWFEQNLDKDITVCDEDILHGSLGYSKTIQV